MRSLVSVYLFLSSTFSWRSVLFSGSVLVGYINSTAYAQANVEYGFRAWRTGSWIDYTLHMDQLDRCSRPLFLSDEVGWNAQTDRARCTLYYAFRALLRQKINCAQRHWIARVACSSPPPINWSHTSRGNTTAAQSPKPRIRNIQPNKHNNATHYIQHCSHSVIICVTKKKIIHATAPQSPQRDSSCKWNYEQLSKQDLNDDSHERDY